jgi:KaiC/GvpD/RAD55 family RecA-like ATPase
MSLEGPSQHRGALAHADDPVPVAGRRSVRGGRIRYLNLNRMRLEPHRDICAAAAVARGVGQRLLQDPVGRPGHAAGQRAARPAQVGGDGQPGGAVLVQ